MLRLLTALALTLVVAGEQDACSAADAEWQSPHDAQALLQKRIQRHGKGRPSEGELRVKFVKAGVECGSRNSRTGCGRKESLQECADAVEAMGGRFFIFGTGRKSGTCYLEKTESADCPEGFKKSDYDFYALVEDEATTPSPTTPTTVAASTAAPSVFPTDATSGGPTGSTNFPTGATSGFPTGGTSGGPTGSTNFPTGATSDFPIGSTSGGPIGTTVFPTGATSNFMTGATSDFPTGATSGGSTGAGIDD